MIKYIGTLLILTGLLSVGCQDPQQKLYGEVMAIHDEMMPDWHKVKQAKMKLEPMMKNAEQQKDTSTVAKYQMTYQQLDKAYEAMSVWMNQFKTPTVEMPKEEAMKYLEDQKVKVIKMKEVMETNINAARKVIEF